MTSSNNKRLKQVLARAIVCGILLVLPSCAIPPFRPAPPAPGLPPTFKGTAKAENSAQLGIAEFFNEPNLTDLIGQAMAGNRELQILNEEVQIARADILARQGSFLPFITAGGSGGLERASQFTPMGAAERDLTYLPGRHFPDPVPTSALGLNLFWQLDIWRELRNARDAARQRFLAASERRNYFVTKLVAEVAENYYGLMARDLRLENLNRIIKLQKESLKIAQSRFLNPAEPEGKQGVGAFPVRRFEAEISKNESQKLITVQEIIQVENRINFLLNRYPQPVERMSSRFFDLNIPLNVGLPAQLLQNRPDIRQAERELAAAGLDVKVARAHFFPKVAITGTVGYEAFNPKYLFLPEALAANAAGNLITPLVNKKAIQAEYLTANARQLQSVYNYQRVILKAFTEVFNRVAKVDNYSKAVELKKHQVEALEAAVKVANQLYLQVRLRYIDVLFAQRDLWDARFELIETKQEQLFAVISTYQALGGGLLLSTSAQEPPQGPQLMPPVPMSSDPTVSVGQVSLPEDFASRRGKTPPAATPPTVGQRQPEQAGTLTGNIVAPPLHQERVLTLP